MFGRVAHMEEGGSVGIIECSATSGGEWVGTLRYGFHMAESKTSEDVAVGDVVSFVPGRSEDGSSWALQVSRMACKNRKHGLSYDCAEGQMCELLLQCPVLACQAGPTREVVILSWVSSIDYSSGCLGCQDALCSHCACGRMSNQIGAALDIGTQPKGDPDIHQQSELYFDLGVEESLLATCMDCRQNIN